MQLDNSRVREKYVANHRANAGPAAMPVVAADRRRAASCSLTAISLPLEKYGADEYYSSETIPESKHFGVQPYRRRPKRA
jgi:hypothetical protein